MQKEHTPCEDPLTDEAALMSEFDLILLFSLVSELYGCLISIQICSPHAIAEDMYIVIVYLKCKSHEAEEQKLLI